MNGSYTIENILSQSLVPPTNNLSPLESLMPMHLTFNGYPIARDLVSRGNTMMPWNYGNLDMSQGSRDTPFPPIFPFLHELQLGKK